MELKQYEKAEEYFFKSLRDSTKNTLNFYTNINFHALGINYSRWGKYDLAIKNNLKALEYFTIRGNRLYQFDVLNNIAVLFSRQNLVDSTIIYGNRALEIARLLENKMTINAALQTIAEGYLQKKDFFKARDILLSIANDTLDHNIVNGRTKAAYFGNLSLAYEGLQKCDLALKHYKRFHAINDSVEVALRESKVNLIEASYRRERTEKEFAQKELAVEQEQFVKLRFQVMSVCIGITALLFLSGLLYNLYRFRINNKELISTKDHIKRLKEDLFTATEEDLFNFFKKKYTGLGIKHLRVLESMYDGLTLKEYAEKIKRKENTIKTWRTKLFYEIKKKKGYTGKINEGKAIKEYRTLLEDFKVYDSARADIIKNSESKRSP
jgi:tetratricopeptide (TPR) repeat protein